MTSETNTHIVAKFLSENDDIGIAELLVGTGLTKTQVDNTLEQLMSRGVVVSIPKRYELTAKGLEELNRPNAFPPRPAPGMGRRRKSRTLAVEVQPDASSVVGFAKANLHPLHMAWGAV